MITCKLGEKTYSVDFISGRALREMEPAANMYAKIVAFSNAAVKGEAVPEDASFTIPSAMDVMIHWFCLLKYSRAAACFARRQREAVCYFTLRAVGG